MLEALMKDFKKRRGVLLIEVIIYISIILLLTTVILSHNGFSRLNSDIFIKQFVSDIRYVYSKNRFGDYDTRLRYIYEGNKTTGKILGYYIDEKGYPRKTVMKPDSLDFLIATKADIRFSSSGVLAFNGETMELADKTTKKKYKITIVPISGRVYVYNE